MINIKSTSTQSNTHANPVAHGHKRVKVREIDNRQFGLIANHLVCFAHVNGQYFYRGEHAIAHIKHKLPSKLVQAWLY